MFGKRAVCQLGVVAKEFRTVVDDAVAIQIAHQQTVVGCNPASGGADAVAVVVEEAA